MATSIGCYSNNTGATIFPDLSTCEWHESQCEENFFMVHTTDPWEKLISLCIMLPEMNGDAVGFFAKGQLLLFVIVLCLPDCVCLGLKRKTHFNSGGV